MTKTEYENMLESLVKLSEVLSKEDMQQHLQKLLDNAKSSR